MDKRRADIAETLKYYALNRAKVLLYKKITHSTKKQMPPNEEYTN
jgi:hypothetical protein